jgi:hypothetical protein
MAERVVGCSVDLSDETRNKVLIITWPSYVLTALKPIGHLLIPTSTSTLSQSPILSNIGEIYSMSSDLELTQNSGLVGLTLALRSLVLLLGYLEFSLFPLVSQVT